MNCFLLDELVMARARWSEVLLIVLLYAVSIVAVLPPTPVLDVTLIVCIIWAVIVAWRSELMPMPRYVPLKWAMAAKRVARNLWKFSRVVSRVIM